MSGPNIINSEKKSDLLKKIVESLEEEFKANSKFILSLTNFNLLSTFEASNVSQQNYHDFLNNGISNDERYDLLFVDLPWNIRSSKDSKIAYKNNAEYELIKKSLLSLSEKGLGLFLLPPSFLFSKKANDFRNELQKLGFSMSLAFNLPEDFLEGLTSVRPIIVGFQRKTNKELFVAEIDYSSELDQFVKAYKAKHNTGNIHTGLVVESSSFSSFANLKIQQQVDSLNSGYKFFDTYPIEKLSLETLTTRERFEEKENALLIPKIGNSPTEVSFKCARLKHQNYFYVVLDKNKVFAEYLKIYFSSELGRLSLEALSTYSFIPHRNKSELVKLIVPVPTKKIQKQIINTQVKLNSLKAEISNLESELSLNPQDSNKIQEIAISALESLDKLSNEEKVLRAIRTGETREIEFKQTFNIDVRTGKKEKYIQESALKNIVAFLNTNGGVLLIGVKDTDRLITGIEADNYQDDDRYSLSFKNSIKSKIGEKYYPFIEWNIVNIKDKKVLLVECIKSDSPCYLDDRDFYVRTNPATDKLEGPKLVEYINTHFGKK